MSVPQLSSAVSSEVPATNAAPITAGVIGAGRWGEKLISALSASNRYGVAAICDSDVQRLGRYQNRSSTRLVTNIHDVLRDDHIDAVFIATPPPTHAALTLAALGARKHVFVEKPMTLSLIEAQEVGRALRLAGRRLLVGHVLRYHPGISELEQLVQAGTLGTLRHFESQRLGRATSDGSSVAAWWELAPHDVSLARAFFGCDPAFVSARRSVGGQRIEAKLVFPQERTAALTVGEVAGRRIRRITLRGTRAVAHFDDRDPSSRARILTLPRPEALTELHFEDHGATTRGFANSAGDALSLELCHFADAVAYNRPVLTDFEEGERVVAVLEMGARSLANGGQWTRIPLHSDASRPADDVYV